MFVYVQGWIEIVSVKIHIPSQGEESTARTHSVFLLCWKIVQMSRYVRRTITEQPIINEKANRFVKIYEVI